MGARPRRRARNTLVALRSEGARGVRKRRSAAARAASDPPAPPLVIRSWIKRYSAPLLRDDIRHGRDATTSTAAAAAARRSGTDRDRAGRLRVGATAPGPAAGGAAPARRVITDLRGSA